MTQQEREAEAVREAVRIMGGEGPIGESIWAALVRIAQERDEARDALATGAFADNVDLEEQLRHARAERDEARAVARRLDHHIDTDCRGHYGALYEIHAQHPWLREP